MKSDLLLQDVRRHHLILNLGKDTGIKVGELTFALKQHVIGGTRAGCRSPICHGVLETAILILKNGRELSAAIVPRNRLAPELNRHTIALLLVSCSG